MANVVPGRCSCRWQAAPIPEMPAPTMSTSTCSIPSAVMRSDGTARLDRRVKSAPIHF